MHLRAFKFQNFPGGACTQAHLDWPAPALPPFRCFLQACYNTCLLYTFVFLGPKNDAIATHMRYTTISVFLLLILCIKIQIPSSTTFMSSLSYSSWHNHYIAKGYRASLPQNHNAEITLIAAGLNLWKRSIW